VTVAELKKLLAEYPDDFAVVIASDEEGNSFHIAYELGYGHLRDTGYEVEFSTWVYDNEDDTSERQITLDESDAVCIWP